MRQDVEDLLSSLTFIDENNLKSKLPTFVAADPDMLPSIKLTDGDLVCVMNSLSNIDQSLNNVKSDMIGEMSAEFAKMCALMNDTIEMKIASALCQQRKARIAEASNQVTSKPLLNPSVQQLRSNASAHQTGRTPSTSGGEELTSDDALEDASDMTTVTSKRKKRKRISNSPTTQTMSYLEVASKQPQSDTTKLQLKKSALNQPRRKTFIGGSTSCPLKAANTLLVKKKVFKLGNIDASYQCSDVTDYMTSLGVRVVSCFVLKPREYQPKNNLSYRICVFAADAHKLLIKDNWSSGITLTEWFFKPKVPGAPESDDGGRTSGIVKATTVSAASNAVIEQPTDMDLASHESSNCQDGVTG